jgi:pimeloyl-ACP methyl ester carboxylesterase
MTKILLVHGAAHGAWCWRDTIPELQKLGHETKAIDLPGHGDDTTPTNDVTLDLYSDAIIRALNEPMVIVGHSMAGFPISLAAERRPDLFQRLIYLCAYVPKVGFSLSKMRREAPRQPLSVAFQRAKDGKSFSFDSTHVKERFYGDCTDEQIEFAKTNLCPQAIQPSEIQVAFGANYASVPRHYIRCKQDGAIPYEFQVAMTEGWPAKDVVDMNVSHSPFFSSPGPLAAHIDNFIRG